MLTITDAEFWDLSTFIKSNYGINLKEEKKALVIMRLSNILESKGLSTFTEYFEHLIKDTSGEEVVTLIDKITTNHTFFMREAEHFEYFKNTTLPYWSKNIRDKDLRVWCAACSSGEEPYTLAMLIDEYFGREKYFWDSKVLATDISSKVLDLATKGIYENDKIESLPPSWKLNYIKKYDDENYVILDKIKTEVIFRKLNLMNESFPFKKKFHVIFCRNVMIYFDNQTKIDLIEKFYDMTETGGYLFIGHSESINRNETKYTYIKPAVYRKE